MNNIMTDSIFFGAVISVVGYLIGIFLRKKISVLNPLLVSIIFVIAVIKIFHIDYETYNSGAKYISYLLTPATVCLAIPLYRQISVLERTRKGSVYRHTCGSFGKYGKYTFDVVFVRTYA